MKLHPIYEILHQDNLKIINAFSNIHPIIVETESMHEAIKVASLYAESGDFNWGVGMPNGIQLTSNCTFENNSCDVWCNGQLITPPNATVCG